MKYLMVSVGLILVTVSFGQDHKVLSISGVEVEGNQIQQDPSLNHPVMDLQDFDPTKDTLSTPNPSREAVALYRFIQDMFGKKTLSGQMWVPWGIHEINYVQDITGKKPAIAGFDYINEPSNNLENQRAIDYWKNGGISTMMWHWGAPGVGEGYENSKATIDIDQCYIEGTPEYEDFWADLERIANYLEVLKNANVPVLWRPLHELNGNWFWWSKGGPEQFKKLWITMYDYFVHERQLNNLIWVLCYTGNPNGYWFPGDEYVDIAGADTYDNLTDSHLTMFNDVLESIDGNNYPVTFHETGNPPDPQECIRDGAMWSWWMIWHTDWLTGVDEQYLKYTYESDLIMTLADLPDITNTYGWEDSCTPGNITASVRLDDGDWLATNKVGVEDGTLLTLRVETEDEGSWKWSGYGTTVNPDLSETEQNLTIEGTGTAMAIFTNTCGAVTTQTFHVIEGSVIEGPLEANVEGSYRFTVFPSPASELLNIYLPNLFDKDETMIRLIDLKGVMVMSGMVKGNRGELDVSALVPGIYTVMAEGKVPVRQKILIE